MVRKEVEHIYVNVPSWTGKNIVQNAPWMGAAMEAEGILSSLDSVLAEFGGIGFSSQLGALEQVTMSYGKLEGAVKYLPDVIREYIDVPLLEAFGRLDEAFAGMEYSRVKMYNGSGLTEGKKNVKGLDEKERDEREKGVQGIEGFRDMLRGNVIHKKQLTQNLECCRDWKVCGETEEHPLPKTFLLTEIVSNIKNDLKAFGVGAGYVMDKLNGVAEELQESQRIMEERRYIDKYVNEETLGEINSRWTENMGTFKDKYGDTVFEDMKRYMNEYGITDEVSILMFLSTMGEETGYGSNIGQQMNGLSDFDYEKEDNRDKYGIPIISSDTGIGLCQVTGVSQNYFVKDLYEKYGDESDKQRILDYFDISEDYFEQYEYGEAPKLNNAAGFIYEYYPIEASMWYWGGTTMKCAVFEEDEQINMSINDYIIHYNNVGANKDNVFLATQYSLNGLRNFKKGDMNILCEQNESVWSEGDLEVKINERVSAIPNGWVERQQDWERASELMKEEAIE